MRGGLSLDLKVTLDVYIDGAMAIPKVVILGEFWQEYDTMTPLVVNHITKNAIMIWLHSICIILRTKVVK